jgi:hypothetical protein
MVAHPLVAKYKQDLRSSDRLPACAQRHLVANAPEWLSPRILEILVFASRNQARGRFEEGYRISYWRAI